MLCGFPAGDPTTKTFSPILGYELDNFANNPFLLSGFTVSSNAKSFSIFIAKIDTNFLLHSFLFLYGIGH
jgi:hypothetical protein